MYCYRKIWKWYKIKRYGFISTGNLAESTAKIYTDVTLFLLVTMIKDIVKIFDFFDVNYRVHRLNILLFLTQYTRTRFTKLIDQSLMHSLAEKHISN
jgi:polyphosphate kinase